MEAFTNLDIDLTTRHPFGPWVYAVQGDVNSRRVCVALLANRRPWSVPAGAEVSVEYRLPSGAKGLYNLLADGTPAVHVQGNRVNITLTSQMLSEPGEVRAAVIINNESLDQITSFPFIVAVQANPFAWSQKAEDYIRLQWLEDKLREWIQEMITTEKAVAAGIAADNADSAAGNAREQAAAAEAAAEMAKTAAAGANLAKATAETAAVSADDSAEEAQTATGAANEAAVTANQAAASANLAAASANEAAAAAQTVVDTVAPDIALAKDSIARHAEEIDNRIKKFYTSNLGAVSVPDSDDGQVRNLVIGGHCTQVQTKGYQLIRSLTAVSSTQIDVAQSGNAFTVTTLSEGVYRQSNADIYADTLPAGTYTASAEISGPGGVILRFLNSAGNKNAEVTLSRNNTTRTITIEETCTLKGVFLGNFDSVVPTGTVTTISGVMLEAGSDAHSWEPYTGGMPSPSADYPQEIKSVESCSMTVSSTDGTQSRTAVIPVSLRGIGNIRDELYAYGDGTGKLVQRYPDTLDPTKTVAEQALEEAVETVLTAGQVQTLFGLRTYYGGTNVTFAGENSVEPVVNFDYACALDSFVEYIKAAQGDDRKFIYDMDERMADAEYTAAMAYVNAEYAAALTELEV